MERQSWVQVVCGEELRPTLSSKWMGECLCAEAVAHVRPGQAGNVPSNGTVFWTQT